MAWRTTAGRDIGMPSAWFERCIPHAMPAWDMGQSTDLGQSCLVEKLVSEKKKKNALNTCMYIVSQTLQFGWWPAGLDCYRLASSNNREPGIRTRRNISCNRMRNFCTRWSVLAFVLASCPTVVPRVLLGNEILRNNSFNTLANENVAILTNPSGFFPDSLQHIVDYLHFETSTNITAILAPEHGFRGDHQAESGDPDCYVDNATGLTVHSVYRKNQSEIQQVLRDSNTTLLLVDIQDVGTRLYTFVWTMFDVLAAIASTANAEEPEAAADGTSPQLSVSSTEPSVKVVVLDRPNPVGGDLVEGPVLNVSCCASRYGKAPVTHRHGLTVGELALFFDGESFNGTLSRANVS